MREPSLLHPLIPWRSAPVPGLKGQTVLITAGKRDPICPLSLSEQLITWFVDQGANVASHFHDGGHELRQSELQSLSTPLNEG